MHNRHMFTDLKIPAGRRPLTQAEARITTVTGTLFTLMIVAAIFEEFSPQKMSVVFMMLFWIPMLLVHELGHALAARWLGWDVREIVIGFGRTLWQFRMGDTRIKLKLVPVEGYVLPAPRTPQSLRLKSMLIYAAGPGAELLLLAAIGVTLGWDTVFNDSDELSLIALKSLAIVIIYGAGFNLLPFRSEGAVSDGLGIISSPFISSESIELRLLTVELRELGRLLDTGSADQALIAARDLLERHPANPALQQYYAMALSAAGQDDPARDYVRDRLAETDMAGGARRAWLLLQAKIELDAEQPAFLVLDLALQKVQAITPAAPDMQALKGASLVLRGETRAGGNLLADAWRSNDGSADDALMLAYLTIAAARCGNRAAHSHFLASFEQINRSNALQQRVRESAESVIG